MNVSKRQKNNLCFHYFIFGNIFKKLQLSDFILKTIFQVQINVDFDRKTISFLKKVSPSGGERHDKTWLQLTKPSIIWQKQKFWTRHC